MRTSRAFILLSFLAASPAVTACGASDDAPVAQAQENQLIESTTFLAASSQVPYLMSPDGSTLVYPREVDGRRAIELVHVDLSTSPYRSKVVATFDGTRDKWGRLGASPGGKYFYVRGEVFAADEASIRVYSWDLAFTRQIDELGKSILFNADDTRIVGFTETATQNPNWGWDYRTTLRAVEIAGAGDQRAETNDTSANVTRNVHTLGAGFAPNGRELFLNRLEGLTRFDTVSGNLEPAALPSLQTDDPIYESYDGSSILIVKNDLARARRSLVLRPMKRGEPETMISEHLYTWATGYTPGGVSKDPVCVLPAAGGVYFFELAASARLVKWDRANGRQVIYDNVPDRPRSESNRECQAFVTTDGQRIVYPAVAGNVVSVTSRMASVSTTPGGPTTAARYFQSGATYKAPTIWPSGRGFLETFAGEVTLLDLHAATPNVLALPAGRASVGELPNGDFVSLEVPADGAEAQLWRTSGGARTMLRQGSIPANVGRLERVFDDRLLFRNVELGGVNTLTIMKL